MQKALLGVLAAVALTVCTAESGHAYWRGGVVIAPTCFFTGLQCIVRPVIPAMIPGDGRNVALGDLFKSTAGGVVGNEGAPVGIGTLCAA